jgi:hypothetical protein
MLFLSNTAKLKAFQLCRTSVTPAENSPGTLTICYTSFRAVNFPVSRPMFKATSHEQQTLVTQKTARSFVT